MSATLKTSGLLLLFAFFALGCATPSTVETRKQERYSAYTALSPEQRALVDQGHIQIGLPADAVYIAWGRPSQVITGETPAGPMTTWIYTGTGWQEHRYWINQPYGYYGRPYGGRGYGGYYYAPALPTLAYDYVPYRYTSAEVVFEKGLVKTWRHATPPPN